MVDGTLVSQYDDPANFTVFDSGSDAVAINTDEDLSGAAIKVTTTGAAAYYQINDASPDGVSGLDGTEYCTLWMYFHEEQTGTDGPGMLVFFQSDGFTDYYQIAFDDNDFHKLQVPGWYAWTFPLSKATTGGSPAWNNINNVVIRVKSKAGTTAQLSWTIDSLYISQRQTPKLIIMHDDCPDTDYTIAYPYIKSKGLVSNCAVITGLIGDANILTNAQILELYNDGWDIVSHSSDAVQLTGLSGAAVAAKIEPAQVALAQLGIVRASDFFVWPAGAHDATSRAELASHYYNYCRAATGRTQPYSFYRHPVAGSIGFGDDLNIHPVSLCDSTTGDTVAEAKAKLDELNGYGGIGFLVLHKIVESGPTGPQITTADFEEIVDYVKTLSDAGNFDVVKISDVFR